jgi:hypothetical protein
MIYLYQNQNNQAAAVCTRNAQLTNPYYLWSMTHKLSGKNYRFIPFRVIPAVSYKPSYDVFCIDIVSTNPQVLTGATLCGQTNIHLIPGEYDLTIFEQASSSNLNPALAYNAVNDNLVQVIGVNQNIPITYTGASEPVFIIYNPENA